MLELQSSPHEQYTAAGFSATRVFLVPWNERDAFAAAALGRATAFGENDPACYPGKPDVTAALVRIEPFEPAVPEEQTLSAIDEGLNTYPGYAKVTVEYATTPAVDLPEGPDNEPGTEISYRMTHSGDEAVLPSAAFVWEDLPGTSLSDAHEIIRRLSFTEHLLTWKKVVNPPWDAIRELQGCVNAATFIDCATETLLFAGAKANKLYQGGFDEGPSEFCWQIAYTFLERAVKHDGTVYGWNHVFRADPPGWARPVTGSTRLYDAGDFGRLFVSEEE